MKRFLELGGCLCLEEALSHVEEDSLVHEGTSSLINKVGYPQLEKTIEQTGFASTGPTLPLQHHLTA